MWRIYGILFFVGILMAQPHHWQRTNPGGGGAFNTVGASSSGIIIVGSDLSGAYRSTDGGENWDVIGAAQGLTETHISGLGFHPQNGNLLFIGTENGIFRSTDGGKTVHKVLSSGYITDIVFSSVADSIGYAAVHPAYDVARGSIYRSNDTGENWQLVSTNLPDSLHILKLVLHPADANTIFMLTGAGRFVCGPAEVYRSTDGGTTWVLLTHQLPPILDLAIGSAPPYPLFVTTMHASCQAPYYWTDLEGNFYRSTDNGNTWVQLSAYTGIILPDPNQNNIIRLIDPREPYPWNDRAGTFTSYDGGVTFTLTGEVTQWDTFYNHSTYWSYGSSFNGICKTIGRDFSNPNHFFWVTTQWAFQSLDSGKTFQNMFTREVTPGFWQSRGLDNVNTQVIAISPANPDVVYVGYFDLGIWRSVDGGVSWQSCNDSLYTGSWDGHGGNCATMVLDPERPNVIWASQSEYQNGEFPTYLLKSTQGGVPGSWEPADDGLPREQIMGLSLDSHSPAGQRTLYVTAQRDVYKSTDDGSTWQKVLDCNGCRFTAVDAVNPQLIYAGGERGIFVSRDGGNTWQDVSLPEMRSTGGSDYWDWDYEGIFDIQSDPNQENTVYVVVHGEGKGLYKSTNGGTTWEKILTNNFLRKVAIVPANSRFLYATSSSAFQAGGYDPRSDGILFSTDGGINWRRQNQGMAYPFAFAVAVDFSDHPTVFVGVPGTGVQRSPVPDVVAIEHHEPFTYPLQVFPNPARQSLWVRLPNPTATTLRLFNVLGEEWTSRMPIINTSPTAVQLDLTHLPNGVYFLKYKHQIIPFTKF